VKTLENKLFKTTEKLKNATSIAEAATSSIHSFRNTMQG
jgi:hypothetical protein